MLCLPHSLISSSERRLIRDGVAKHLRLDGRGMLDYRSLEIELGVVAHANGSARVRRDSTDVLVGVKLELGIPEPQRPDYGIICCSVEW